MRPDPLDLAGYAKVSISLVGLSAFPGTQTTYCPQEIAVGFVVISAVRIMLLCKSVRRQYLKKVSDE